jgi:uncharacterized cofD-like protein
LNAEGIERVPDIEPRIVAIGGGTGLSALLRGLKVFTPHITAVVTVADDGGSSGRLRRDYGILPPGDIRNCILALADAEPMMERLIQYRFREGELHGHSLGNLLIAALADLSDGFRPAVHALSDVLAITGTVYPVTEANVTLRALLRDGTYVEGESAIPRISLERGAGIRRIELTPGGVSPLPEVLHAIGNADVILLGPGSLYTSIMPNLLVPGMADAIRASRGLRLYIANIMTQPGETDGYDMQDHLDAIRDHAGGDLIDTLLINSALPDESILRRYEEDEAYPVVWDRASLISQGYDVIEKPLLDKDSDMGWHDSIRLAQCVMDALMGG